MINHLFCLYLVMGLVSEVVFKCIKGKFIE